MSDPEGSLTAAQHEIMEIIWAAGKQGASVGDVWQAIEKTRKVARTTILNQIDRLESRGWLVRIERENPNRFVAGRMRDKAEQELANEFVDSFFGGSASQLVMSLLEAKKLKPSEIAELRALLDSKVNYSKRKG